VRLFFLLFFFFPLVAQEAQLEHALYMMQNGGVEDALTRYQSVASQTGRHYFEILQRMSMVLLRQGIQSEDPMIFVLSLFGAGLSGSSNALEILEKGISHPDPQVQMIALHFLVKIEDDRIDEILNRAMSSDFLSTRMEAAFYMAQKKHPHAVGQIEGLMQRLPPFFRPFFPSLFALIGTSDATQVLKRLLDDLDPHVRVESILHCARMGRDDLLPIVRKRLSHCNSAELEACAYAIGLLQDSNSIKHLKRLAYSASDPVKIAAILALQALGNRSALAQLEKLALEQNLHAIAALGQISGTEQLLTDLAKSQDMQVRLNASLSLLALHDRRCMPGIEEVLISDVRDLAFYPFPSIGRTISCWKAVPSAELRSKDQTLDLSLSFSLREHVLREAQHLPPGAFLVLGKKIFTHKQLDLVPCLINLLENLRTPEAIALLKEGCTKLDVPLIRDYCHLALYRLKEEGPYEKYMNHWILQQKDAELIRLRPMLPWKWRESEYSLTPEETSQLLVDAFIAVARRQDEKSIDFLVKAITLGNPHNRYALVGLLMRATE
jgi:HEAT repeat protein